MPASDKTTPTAALRLRPGVTTDVDGLLALERESFRTDLLSRRSFRGFIASPSAVLTVAEVGGRLAGYVLVTFRAGSAIARLYSIAVAPGMSGRGIGPRLLDSAETVARRRRCTTMRLEVHEHNAAAIGRYRKSGYRLFGRHLHYYEDRGHALRFEKRLGASSTDHKDSSSPPASVAR